MVFKIINAKVKSIISDLNFIGVKINDMLLKQQVKIEYQAHKNTAKNQVNKNFSQRGLQFGNVG